MKLSTIRSGLLAFIVLSALSLSAAQWASLGPDGGDARSLAYDPVNPDRIYLGTSAGELYLSIDGGSSWSRCAHLGKGQDYVLDNIAVDPKEPNVIYVAAWSVETQGGDLFKSTDSGKTWKTLPGVAGKSIRAMALAPSDPKVIAVGALDGVYRSKDAGQTWDKITPVQNELRNFESIAFDPKNPDVVYAGTWHLPWKSVDGGRSWQNIRQGIIDDSDVFSIIVDQRNPAVVYVSACSGIYKSDNSGWQFRKVQGIPFSARRTRVLQQDPTDSSIVYAGTTEGLWKTRDSGASWKLVSPASYIVNDVLVDPRNPQRVLIATDRNGVLASGDGGLSFVAANRGFSHRQVTGFVVDRKNSGRMYASLINNRELGGIFVSNDGGANWSKFDNGLGGRDVFAMDQAPSGTLVVGTNRGMFALEPNSGLWKPINTVLREKLTTIRLRSPKKGAPRTKVQREWIKSEITGRVSALKFGSDRWYAATSQGLFRSLDAGKSWTGGPILGATNLIAVDSLGSTVIVASPNHVLLSNDSGETWSELQMPPYVSRVYDVALGPQHELWITTHMGSFRSSDAGKTWEHLMVGEPLANLTRIAYDPNQNRVMGVAAHQIYETQDGGNTWKLTVDSHWPVRQVSVIGEKMYAVTEFSGVVMHPLPVSVSEQGGTGAAQASVR